MCQRSRSAEERLAMIQAEVKGQELNQALTGDGTAGAHNEKQTEKPAPGGPDLDTMVTAWTSIS